MTILGFSSVYPKEARVNIPKEFQLSKVEKRDIEKCLKKVKTKGVFDLNKALEEASNGNPIAMYIVGQSCLIGAGISINRNAANLYLKMAASLGYAPALYQIFQIYALEKQDPLLAFVYLNLTISYGHGEYIDFYYQETEWLSKLTEPAIVKEIERIALEKDAKILKLRTEIKKHKNTFKPATMLVGQNLTMGDVIYSEKYWKKFFKSEEKWNRFFFGEKEGQLHNKLR